jgi:hypothetical protein
MGTKSYLGDGVYVELERGMIKLTTGEDERNGEAQNTIYLESEVFHNLKEWANRMAHLQQVRE